MFYTDDRGHGDGGVTHRGIVQIARADPLPARVDQILGAVPDLHRALRIDGRDIAGGQPSIDESAVLRLVVARNGPLSPYHQMALRLPIARQVGAAFIDAFDLDTEGCLS